MSLWNGEVQPHHSFPLFNFKLAKKGIRDGLERGHSCPHPSRENTPCLTGQECPRSIHSIFEQSKSEPIYIQLLQEFWEATLQLRFFLTVFTHPFLHGSVVGSPI